MAPCQITKRQPPLWDQPPPGGGVPSDVLLTYESQFFDLWHMHISEAKFNWECFWKDFPYGDLRSSQGQYQQSVIDALLILPKEQQVVLLDLLDLQWMAYAEQLSIISSHDLAQALAHQADTTFARLQINSNLRGKFGLPRRDMRGALMRLAPGEVLDKIESASKQD